MKEIDRMIRDALREEDAELHEKFGGDQPIHEAITDLFRFNPRWLLLMTMLFTLIFIVAAVFSGYRFYYAPEIREMLIWGGICFASIGAVTAIKIWAWMEMSKNAVIREIKRLELQTAYLAGKIKKSQSAQQDEGQ